jgi:hypothetical protein
VTNGGGLFAYRDVGLAVAVSLRPELARVFLAFARFNVEIVGLLAALVDEILGEVQVAPFAGCFV